MTLAWMTVNLGATTWAKGRVPELQGLLTAGRPKVQSMAEQKAALELIAQRLGRRLTTKHDRMRDPMDVQRKATH